MSRIESAYTRTRSWARAHPLASDGALAAAVLACMIFGSFTDHGSPEGPTFGTRTPDPVSVLLMVLSGAALVFRRRAPMPVLFCTAGLTLLELLLAQPPAPLVLSAVIALYTVGSRTDRPTTWRVGVATMSVLTAVAMILSPGPWYAQENLSIFAWTGMASAAGDAVRSRRAFVGAIRERAERAERTREEEARRRVAEERLRIARDLHDVVAHHIALVNVQAGVASHVMDKRPDQAKEALAHVREAGRSALSELRATVGLLRQSGDPAAPTEPAPGLAHLDRLLDTFRNAGLPVEFAMNGRAHAQRLPAAADLAAYRIIQEALTNVRKHGGPTARAEVSVVHLGATVEITVLDNGGGTGAPVNGTDTGADTDADPGHPDPGEPDGGGHGLIGMRERVTALGGTLTAAPRYGGGFRTQAILPVNDRTRQGKNA
ncbi:sensor histidine kinase [Streptomyces sp. NBC_01429]|uniref:sensor histidine kinase n=1 Tax=Streptomyces sp. NBC_01429 TaxID=2903862 RepID=UPI002E2DB6E6|nr:histidine kinase [Streptomyces sp. NBC_01429]